MVWDVTPEEFLALYNNYREDIIILDVREIEEYEKYHLSNSILIPVGEIYYRINELDVNKDIYIICEHGNRSTQAALILYDLGFKRVFNVMGGFERL
jgi:rhodanese-related sulfurtransferase